MERRGIVTGLLGAGLAAPAVLQAKAAPVPGNALERILEAGRIRIGIAAALPPWSFRGPDGEWDGAEVALARRLAADLNVALDLVPLSFGERLGAIEERRVDLAAAVLTITPERVRRVMFAAPHGEYSVHIVSEPGMPLSMLSDLDGQTVAVVRDSLAASMLIADPPRDLQLLWCDTHQAVFESLQDGRAYAAAMPGPMLRSLRLQGDVMAGFGSRFVLGSGHYALAMHYGEHDLLRCINALLFLWRDGGLLASLYQTYAGAPLPEQQAF